MFTTKLGLSRWRTRALTTGVVGAVLLTAVPMLNAHAATVRVATCGTSNDAAAVQGVIDASSPGDTVAIRGTCNLSSVAAHGGEIWSIAKAALIVDKAITITSDGAPRSGVLQGSGTQAGIYVSADGDGATIKGLTFNKLARAIVVWNADSVTIGAAGATNNSGGNRISGDQNMNQAILALQNRQGSGQESGSTTVHVAGRNAEVTTSLPLSANLSNLKVLGNYISYAPVGGSDPSGKFDVVGIDIRQRSPGGATIIGAEHIDIENNAVGMQGTEFPSANMSAVRVVSHQNETAIGDVTVKNNNLGNVTELGEPQAAGRVGIMLNRVNGFTVSGNSVRANLSTTGIPMPGGGIVAADSRDGEITENSVTTLADPSTSNSDLGAIGAINDYASLFGLRKDGEGTTTTTDPLPTTNILIQRNTIGASPAVPGAGSQKGIVLNGVDKAFVTDNVVSSSTQSAMNIGTPAQGPGDPSKPGYTGPATVQSPVTLGVICRNFLDATTSSEANADKTSEITVGQVSSSAFPGGSTKPTDNTECAPQLSTITAGPIGVGGSLAVSGRAWRNRDVTVVVNDQDPTTAALTATTAVGASGNFTTTFTAAELDGLKDGLLTAVASVSTGAKNLSSNEMQTTLAAHPGPIPIGTVTLDDGGDGYTNAVEATSNKPTVGWMAAANVPSGTTAKVWFATSAGQIPGTACGPFLGSPASQPTGGYLTPACAGLLPAEGVFAFNVQWKSGADSSAIATKLSTMDRVVNAPVITADPPTTVRPLTSGFTLNGTSDSDVTGVTAYTPTKTPKAGTASGGAWSATYTSSFTAGKHSFTATATDAAGNVSAASAPQTIKFSDAAPPAAPVVTSPVASLTNPAGDIAASVVFSGDAPVGSVVVLTTPIGSPPVDTELGRAATAPNGKWAIGVSGMAGGQRAFTFVAIDNVDRVSAPTVRNHFVDNVKPVVAFTQNASSFYPTGPAVVKGNALDNRTVISRVVVQLKNAVTGQLGAAFEATTLTLEPASGSPEDAGYVPAHWKWEVSFTPPVGAWSGQVFAVDAAGNVSNPGTVTTFVSIVPPSGP